MPAFEGESNFSRNTSYNEDLRHNESAFNADESFVYITDINIHDENLNVVAKAKLAGAGYIYSEVADFQADTITDDATAIGVTLASTSVSIN